MIKDRGLLYPPTPITLLYTNVTNKKDKSSFCKFHNTLGHTTIWYCNFKNQAEDVVRDYYLNEFIDSAYLVAD